MKALKKRSREQKVGVNNVRTMASKQSGRQREWRHRYLPPKHFIRFVRQHKYGFWLQLAYPLSSVLTMVVSMGNISFLVNMKS